MIQQDLIFLLNRDLQKLKSELLAYSDENKIWNIRDGISNSAGNLTLHIIGNLNQFIGNVLGGSGYVRNRELEFSSKFIRRNELIQKLDETIDIVMPVLGRLTEEQLSADFPLSFNAEMKSTMQVLIHIFGHLNYHLGQINYHRRLS